MKQFLVFVKKEFYHIFRDRRTLLILFGMPIALVVLFGFALSNEIKNAKIAVLDFDKNYHSQKIMDKLFSSGYFELSNNLYTYEGIEAAFRQGEIKMAIVFPANFSHDLDHLQKAQIQLIADASDQNTATTLSNYATAIIKAYEAENIKKPIPIIRIDTQTRMYFNPELKGVYVFVPGSMALILMLVSAMMTSITIAREKEMGTMEILLVSPLQQVQIVIGKIVPYFLLSFINALTILALGVFVLDMPMKGNILLLLLETLLFIFTSLSLGILISSRSSTQQAAMLVSMMGLMMPTTLLSGFIFPVESMPLFLQYVSHIIPAHYFIIIIKNIMIKGVGFGYVWLDSLVLLVMALFFLGMGWRNLKPRLS